jgi:hypothetical protein
MGGDLKEKQRRDKENKWRLEVTSHGEHETRKGHL